MSHDVFNIVLDNSIEILLDQGPDFEIIEIGKQGPQGPQGPPGSGDNIGPIVVPAGQTIVVDTVLLSLYRSVKWFVSISDLLNSKYNYSEFASVHDGTLVSYYRIGLVGDSIAITHDIAVNGTDVELKITNNEIVNITLDMVRVRVTI